ncbi:MAG: Hpt domain-containing protein, partial [Candidatus Eisenbacteria bacterium]
MPDPRQNLEAVLNRLAVAMAIEPEGSDTLRDRLADGVVALEACGTPADRKHADGARAVLRSPNLAGLADWLAQVAPQGAEPPVPVAEAPPGPPTVEDDLASLKMDPDLAAMFVAEALDHLATIENTLLQLEATPGDQKLLNDVFRPFHTIKGNSGALGLGRMQQLAHTVENMLDLARAGRYALGAAEFDAILQSVDVLSALIRDTQARLHGAPGEDLEPRRVAMVTLFEGLVRRGPAIAEAAPAPREPMTSTPTPLVVPVAAPVPVTNAPVAAASAPAPARNRTPAAPGLAAAAGAETI